ncbi:MAG: hypothetical protein FWD72_00355 [Eggerthellaceae bacterium]|nr:hypothetical protein [Eggerthellaceae bacterium]
METTFEDRVKIIDDAIALKKTDRVPFAPNVESLPYFFSDNGTTYKDCMYDYPKASEAIIKFYKELMPDAQMGALFNSGRSNELAGSRMIDWPGRPGTKVPDFTTYQVLENEYMSPDEYPELLRDYTGFMIRKYIPRAYSNLGGLAPVSFLPTIVLGTGLLAGLYNPSVIEAFDIIKQIGAHDGEAAAAAEKVGAELAALGIPPMMTGIGEAPFDILSDYFRTTTGAMEDMLECPDMVEAACDLFADIQIASWEYFKFAPLPVKRVFFPLHKGMDGFMGPKQFDTLYWKPLLKCVNALVAMGVTPFLYSEGNYFSRIDAMTDLPKGKCILHFESADPAACKKAFKDVACLSGFFPIYHLEWSSKQTVIDETKRYLDILADGGGYIFDTNAVVENAKRENWEAMVETVRGYKL